MIRKHILLIPVALSYAILAWFVYFVINPLCYNIFQQPAFVLTADFFWTKVSVPGGLAEYFQTFIDQFTMFRFWGTVFLVAELFLTAVLANRYVRKTVGGNAYTSLITHILAVAIAIVAWTDVKYPFAINMKALILVAVLNVHSLLESHVWYRYIMPLFAIFIYITIGAVPLYIFAICCIIHYSLKKSQQRIVIMCEALACSALIPFLFYKYIMPINAELAFYQLVPQKYMFITFGFRGIHLLVLFYIPIALLLGVAYTNQFFVKTSSKISIFIIAVICAGTYGLVKMYDKPTERISYKMEVAAFNNQWDNIIKYVKDNPELCTAEKYDRNINFYYDMALAKKNQLATKMLTYPQLLGIDALFLDEPVATVVCLPLAMFYYNMGLVTNSLHFALEAQTSYPSSHYTMRYVIDCLIMIGDYRTAEKFLDKYEKNMLSKKYINDRRKIINGREDVVDREFTQSYINGIREKHPRTDFYMQSRQNNMLQLLLVNPKNQMASQYLACSALLQNDLELFVQVLMSGIANVDMNNLPRLYQEAILLYRATSKDVRPDTEQIPVSSYLKDSFSDFIKIYTAKGANYKQVIAQKYSTSYWRYYCIDSPVVSGPRIVLK